MKRNITKIFSYLFVIFVILVFLGASVCVSAFREDKNIAACKFDPDNVPKKVPVEISASVADKPFFEEGIVDSEENDKSEETGKTEETDKNENNDDLTGGSENEKNDETSVPPEEKPKEEQPKEEEKPVEKPVQTEPVKLVGGFASVDRSAYTAEEIELLDTILSKIKENKDNLDIHEEEIPLNGKFSFEEYYKVSSYFYVYYGQKRAVYETFDLVNASSDSGYLRLRYDDIREFERVRNQNQAKIDAILSTFTDGSEEHILRQISEYMRHNIVYTNGKFDLSCALDGGSVCNGYALMFNAMANRAGIISDICIGKMPDGQYHAWNRVTLKDGTYRFYDITFYDSNSANTKYLHSTTSFHGVPYLINDYSACWLKK